MTSTTLDPRLRLRMDFSVVTLTSNSKMNKILPDHERLLKGEARSKTRKHFLL